jgi:hypothetical protein
MSNDSFYGGGMTLVNCIIFFLGTWTCLKFIFFCCMIINHIMSFFIHKWQPSEFEDDEMLFELGFSCKKNLPCFQIVGPSSCFNLKKCLSFGVHGYDVCYMLALVGLKVCLGLYMSLKGVGKFGIKGMYM